MSQACLDPFSAGNQPDPATAIQQLETFLSQHATLRHSFPAQFTAVVRTSTGDAAMALDLISNVPFSAGALASRRAQRALLPESGLTLNEEAVVAGLVQFVTDLLDVYEKDHPTFMYLLDFSMQNMGLDGDRFVLVDLDSFCVECSDGKLRPAVGLGPSAGTQQVPGTNIFQPDALRVAIIARTHKLDLHSAQARYVRMVKYQTMVMLCALAVNAVMFGRSGDMSRKAWYAALRPGAMDVQNAIDTLKLFENIFDLPGFVDRVVDLTATVAGGNPLLPVCRTERTADQWLADNTAMTRNLVHVLKSTSVTDLGSKDSTKIAQINGKAAVVLGAGNYGVVLAGPADFPHAIKIFTNTRDGPTCVYCPVMTAEAGRVGHYCTDCHLAICLECMAGRRPAAFGWHQSTCTRLTPPDV